MTTKSAEAQFNAHLSEASNAFADAARLLDDSASSSWDLERLGRARMEFRLAVLGGLREPAELARSLYEGGYDDVLPSERWSDPEPPPPPSSPERTEMNPIAQLLRGASERNSGQMPWRITTRDLSRHTSKLLARLHTDQQTAVVTYRGVPAFLVVPVNQDDLVTLFLGNAPQLREDHEAARAELTEDEGTFYP